MDYLYARSQKWRDELVNGKQVGKKKEVLQT